MSKHTRLIDAGIIAVDGEGVTDPDGRHRYTLFHASTGASVAARDLTFEQIANFLLDLPHALVVGYSINYDIVMWIHKLPVSVLYRLHEKGFAKYHGYGLTYIPGRKFGIHYANKSVTVYDQFGFYQTSFVNALKEWQIGTPEQRQQIQAMKERRSEFLFHDAKTVEEYCHNECILLVALTEKLIKACRDADISPSYYWGAGALAQAMLKQHGMKAYNGPAPAECKTAIRSAYFGGRMEIAYNGYIGEAYGYDIRSAYPYQCTRLPCLAHARYVRRKNFTANTYGFWHVEWSLPHGVRWPPFPFREMDGRISFPCSGSGYYWQDEVFAAIQLFGTTSIRVIDGYTLETTCTDNPWEWVEDVYLRRATLKAEKDPAQIVLKLGLNALYGKTVQAVGYRRDIAPTYHSLVWAGLITSGCRAMALQAINQKPESGISIATDGIVSLEPLDLPIGDWLGKWEAYPIEGLWLFQPGVSCYETEGKIVTKTRGFSPREIDYQAVIEAYKANPRGFYEYGCTRFIGLGTALNRTDFRDLLARWISTNGDTIPNRQIRFTPSNRLPGVAVAENRLYLAPPQRPQSKGMSRPYEILDYADRWTKGQVDIDVMQDLEQP